MLDIRSHLGLPIGMIDPQYIPVTPRDQLPPDTGDAGSAVPSDIHLSNLHAQVDDFEVSWTSPMTVEDTLTLTGPRLPRLCHVGCVGPDVVAYKRALKKAKTRSKDSNPDHAFGAAMKGDVAQFQRLKKLPHDGVIGKRTYRELVAYCDAYGLWLLRQEAKHLHKQETALSANQKCVNHALRAVALAAYWHYAEIRPWPAGEAPDHVPTTTDCSGGYGLWRKWGGGRSPFGSYGWSGYGNTDTMLNTGTHVSSPGPGDAILYTNPGHVIMCVRWPMGVSHGSEGGPYYTDVRYKTIYTFRHYE